jgi:hypothetical protein
MAEDARIIAFRKIQEEQLANERAPLPSGKPMREQKRNRLRSRRASNSSATPRLRPTAGPEMPSAKLTRQRRAPQRKGPPRMLHARLRLSSRRFFRPRQRRRV